MEQQATRSLRSGILFSGLISGLLLAFLRFNCIYCTFSVNAHRMHTNAPYSFLPECKKACRIYTQQAFFLDKYITLLQHITSKKFNVTLITTTILQPYTTIAKYTIYLFNLICYSLSGSSPNRS